MKNFKRIFSLIMVIVLAAGLLFSLAGCQPAETATYYITNTTPNTLTVKWIRDVKILQQWNELKEGEVLEFKVDIKKEPNIFSMFYGGTKVGREVVSPETGYVDGGKYYIVIFRTPNSSKDEYKLVPDDGTYVPPVE
ncbi:MAG: hypothetical protein WC332_08635 [Clostridia bacterium]|jgi:hypothetical protein